MADSRNPPLSYEASATTTHPHVATTLPSEVVSCLKNSRFVSLLRDRERGGEGGEGGKEIVI